MVRHKGVISASLPNKPFHASIKKYMSKLRMIGAWQTGVRQIKLETYTLLLAYRHPLVPWYAKIFAAGVVGYAFSPIDLIPDFIPVLGYLDDLILLPLGVIIARKMIPKPVLEECRQKAQERIEPEKPPNWFAASVIILVWLFTFIGLIGVGMHLVNAYR